MHKHIIVAFLSLVAFATALPAYAADAFQIASRHLDLASDDEVLTGYLLIDIQNLGDEDAGEIVISVPGLNKVTYDSRAILVGDLSAGEPRGLIEPLVVPSGLAEMPLPGKNVTWRVEYTNAAGERVEVDVTEAPEPGEEEIP